MADLKSTDDWVPLTLPQLDFWEEFACHPEEPLSTVAHYLDIEGDVNEDALLKAIAETVRESDVLSVRFRRGPEGGQPRQRCAPEYAPEVAFVDLRSAADPHGEAKRQMDADLAQQLDLTADKVSAQVLYRITDTRYYWYLRAHHIIVDGYGMALIERRCGQLYGQFARGADAGPAFHRFGAFLAEEDAYQNSRRWQADRDHWNTTLELPVKLPLIDREAEDYGTVGMHHDLQLPPEYSAKLQAMGKAVGMSWAELLVLLSSAYLYKALPKQAGNGEGYMSVWLPFMSRWGSVAAYVPAMTVNILPLCLAFEPQATLAAFFRGARTELKKHRMHGRYRIEQIATDQRVAKNHRYFFSPLVNVLPFTRASFVGCQVTREVLASGVAEGFNLTFRGEDDGSNLLLQVDSDGAMPSKEFEWHRRAIPEFLLNALSLENLEQPLESLWAQLPEPVRS